MINSDEELSLEYLLSPEFEMINSAGKPLTDGWIEVYIHGTRNKYYCASDFDGTLHPFKIPLDSIGSNIVLADPANSYDVYVYNKFGSLIMSRYNVKCQGGGGTSTVEYLGDRLEYGQYTAHDITTVAHLARQKGNINTTQDGFLKLKEDMSYHITVRGTFVCDHLANVATSLNYIEYSSFNPIKVDIDETVSGEQHFELSYDIFRLPNDMDYQVGFDASNGHISSLAVEVHSLSNLNTTLQGGDLFEQGWGIIIENNVISVDPSIFDEYPTFDDLQAAVTGVHETITNETFELVSSVSSVLQDEIDNIQQGVQSDWEQDDPSEPDYIKNKPDLTEFATHDEVISTVSSVSSTLQHEIDELPRPVNADWNATSGLAEILNKPDLDIYATKDEVSAVTSTIENEISEVVNTVCAVSSVLQEEIDNIPEQVQSDWEQDDDTQKDYIKNKPDLDVYATKSDVTAVSSVLDNKIDTVETEIINTVCAVSSVLQEEIDNIPEQVQSDWDESDTESPAYIQNKPDLDIYATKDELNTATGDIVNTVCAVSSTIETEIDNSVTEIVNTVCAVSSVLQDEIDNIPEQVQSDWDESDPDSPAYIQNKPDLDIYATHDEVSGVSAVLKEIIDEVSAAVPEAQVQSDWTETDDTKKSYIQHKPEVKDVYAGENIILTDTASGLEISAVGTDTETVSGIAKAYADAVSAAIPEAQVQSDWTQDDTTKKDYIKHKPIPKKLVAGEGIVITDTVTGVEISAAVTGIDGYVTEEEFIEVVSAVTGTGDYGQFYCLSASGACNMGKVKGTIDVTNDGKIKLKKGKSYHVSVRGSYTQAVPSNIDSAISFIEYVTNNNIGINVDRTTTMPQYFDLGFDLYNLSADTDYYVFFTNLAGTISNLFVEVHTILGGGGGNGGGGGSGTEYNQGWGIVITNNTISVNPSIIPDVSNLATKNEVTAAIATATGAQINADWNNSNPLSKAYIQNKPEELTLVGGQGVDIEVVGSSAIINVTGGGATGGGGTTYTAGEGIEIDGNNVISVTGMATEVELAAVTATIPADNVRKIDSAYRLRLNYNDLYSWLRARKFIYLSIRTGSDTPVEDYFLWDVFRDGGNLALTNYTNNRVTFSGVCQGRSDLKYYNIVFNYNFLNNSWTSVYTQVVTPSDIPDTSNLATKTELQTVSGAIPEIELNGNDQVTAIDGHELAGGGGGQQVQADWTETDTSDPSYIQNKPEEQMLIAGNNVEITIDGASAIISAQGGGGATYSAGQNISIDSQNVIAVTGLAQADWNSSSGASQILNKPTEKNLVAGANVTITEDNDDVIVETTEIASGLQLVAGPGIVLTVSGNNLVAKTDETVLWSGSWKPGTGTTVTNSAVEVSESVSNFEYIKVVTEGILCQTITMTPNDCQALICYPESDSRTSILGLKVSKDDNTHIRFRCGYSDNFIQSYRSGSDWGYFTLKKIIGVNRIST